MNISQLNVKCETWKKFTEDLFDFETKELEEKEFTLKNNDKIIFVYTDSN